MSVEHEFYFHVMDQQGKGIARIALEGIYIENGKTYHLPVVYTDKDGRAIIESYSNMLSGLKVGEQTVESHFYPGQLYGFQR